ncbi:hypothetical protein QBC46DRAFT_409288 [Diplogelasinospora grovesii]|uniref:Cyanovirin-N domain-containing protein n=1 Tax=Diplogelasinospora grovesii TaxID=303347 RepID=A0AAN6N709_9PEZI|nr:hypothetical protein QBC46DRAFT_409288 [Diplogelasinospora grovesii]
MIATALVPALSAILALPMGQVNAQQGNFSLSCMHDFQSINYTILEANCSNSDGEWGWSQIDLDLCLINNDGYLTFAPTTNASDPDRYNTSCEACRVMGEGHWYSYYGCGNVGAILDHPTGCLMANGSLRATYIDLDSFLVNENGFLCCGGGGAGYPNECGISIPGPSPNPTGPYTNLSCNPWNTTCPPAPKGGDEKRMLRPVNITEGFHKSNSEVLY